MQEKQLWPLINANYEWNVGFPFSTPPLPPLFEQPDCEQMGVE